jgi:UDP-glucose 4-epimerase
MSSAVRRAVVTGAAGFIGSHLCEALISDGKSYVVALDNLKTGNVRNLSSVESSGRLELHKLDLRDMIPVDILRDASLVFHLAANPEVRIGKSDTLIDFENNVVATRNLLEALRQSGFNGSLVFASSSTVYGEPSTIPTPEHYGPLIPISMYGASKLACESLIAGYAKLFGFRAKLIRFANVVGGRSNHGVIFDFIQKLESNPQKLEVLGDGSQSKSYVYIADCVDGLVRCSDFGSDVDVFNLGSQQRTNVLEIGKIVAQEMGIDDLVIEAGHGQEKDGRGWPGDVKNMLLDCQKLTSAGWICKYSSDMAVRRAARDLIERRAGSIKTSI